MKNISADVRHKNDELNRLKSEISAGKNIFFSVRLEEHRWVSVEYQKPFTEDAPSLHIPGHFRIKIERDSEPGEWDSPKKELLFKSIQDLRIKLSTHLEAKGHQVIITGDTVDSRNCGLVINQEPTVRLVTYVEDIYNAAKILSSLFLRYSLPNKI